MLGIGFAFGAAVVGTVADAPGSSAWSVLGLLVWRLAVYALPFIPPLTWRLPPRPHLADGAVVLLALLLPRLPGFQGIWFTVPGEHPGGLLFGGLGPGSLGAPALLATYFYGARFWTAAPLDLRARSGDGRSALGGFLLATAAAWVATFLGDSARPLATPAGLETAWARLYWAVAGIGLAALFEELVFRGLIQAGIRKVWPRGRAGWTAGVAAATAALAGAALHAIYGPFGMTRPVGFGVSLAIGAVFARSNRYFPAAAAHALTLLARMLIS